MNQTVWWLMFVFIFKNLFFIAGWIFMESLWIYRLALWLVMDVKRLSQWTTAVGVSCEIVEWNDNLGVYYDTVSSSVVQWDGAKVGNNCVRLRDSLWFPSEKCNKFLINARFHSSIEFIVHIPIEFDSWFEHFNNSSTIVVNRILGRGYDPRVCDWAKLNGISFESVTPTTKEPTLGRTTLSLMFDKLNTVVQITPSKFFFFFIFIL